MEKIRELEALFDNIIIQILDPNVPPVKNPFEEEEDGERKIRFRSITPVTVVVSEDKLSASIFVSAHEKSQGSYTIEELHKEIEAKGITEGIDEEALENMVAEQLFNTEVVFARGVPAVDGKDGSVTVVAESDTDIEKGAEICRITPAEEGTDGHDVFGEVIHAVHGHAPDVPQGKNTCLNSEHNALIAAASGHLDMEDGVFNVKNEMVIRGDVKRPDNQIVFEGDITIHGNIDEGAFVKAGGSIYVLGSVTSARLSAKQIRVDFTVRNSTLSADGGNIKLMNCIDSKITCDGNLEASSLVNCDTTCSGEVTCLSNQGSICGGKVNCISRIICQVAGSHMREPTLIILGDCTEFMTERNELAAKIELIDSDIRRLDAHADSLKKQKAESGSIPKKDEDFLAAAVKIRLHKIMEKEPLKNRLDYVEQIIGSRVDSSLKVTNTLYPGVSLTIGTHSAQIDTEYGKTIVYSTENGLVFS